MKEVEVSRIDVSTQEVELKKDLIAEEIPLHVFLNQSPYLTLFTSPIHLEELVTGHLLSSGVVKSASDIIEIRFGRGWKCQVMLQPHVDVDKIISTSQSLARIIVSACGSSHGWALLADRLMFPKVKSDLRVEAKIISKAVKDLNKLARIFRKTGGVHVAALYSAHGEVIACSEDVGRHNAVDKVIGAGILKKIRFDKSFLALSGRLTGDLVSKAARISIPVIASMAAAVTTGLETAQRADITLIGFVRGKRMNIYSHPERIVQSAS